MTKYVDLTKNNLYSEACYCTCTRRTPQQDWYTSWTPRSSQVCKRDHIKVEVFSEGHKIRRNHHLGFDVTEIFVKFCGLLITSELFGQQLKPSWHTCNLHILFTPASSMIFISKLVLKCAHCAIVFAKWGLCMYVLWCCSSIYHEVYFRR